MLAAVNEAEAAQSLFADRCFDSRQAEIVPEAQRERIAEHAPEPPTRPRRLGSMRTVCGALALSALAVAVPMTAEAGQQPKGKGNVIIRPLQLESSVVLPVLIDARSYVLPNSFNPADLQPVRPVPAETAPADKISEQGVQLVGGFEGWRPQLYNDPAGHATIGFGHLVHHGPINGSEPAEFKKGLTEEEGRKLLRDDLKTFEEAVRSLVKVPLNQNQFDALVSFTFNIGKNGLKESTLLRLLNEGHYDAVPGELGRWVMADGKTLAGLQVRREREAELFMRPMNMPPPSQTSPSYDPNVRHPLDSLGEQLGSRLSTSPSLRGKITPTEPPAVSSVDIRPAPQARAADNRRQPRVESSPEDKSLLTKLLNGLKGDSETPATAEQQPPAYKPADNLRLPPNFNPNDKLDGYVKMPESTTGSYIFNPNTPDIQRYGNELLIKVLFTVAERFHAKYPDSKLMIGDLNAGGHASHKWGVAVDIKVVGKGWRAADFTSNDPYSKRATIELGKMLLDTNVIKNIWFNDQEVNDALLEYATKEKKLHIHEIARIDCHDDHFHVDIGHDDSLKGPVSAPDFANVTNDPECPPAKPFPKKDPKG